MVNAGSILLLLLNLKLTIIFSQQKRGKNVGWSGWSDWSTCSRSCDGGIAHQLRRCHSPQGCKGEPVRYKICNMQVIKRL